jgi:hypothetical protein
MWIRQENALDFTQKNLDLFIVDGATGIDRDRDRNGLPFQSFQIDPFADEPAIKIAKVNWRADKVAPEIVPPVELSRFESLEFTVKRGRQRALQ